MKLSTLFKASAVAAALALAGCGGDININAGGSVETPDNGGGNGGTNPTANLPGTNSGSLSLAASEALGEEIYVQVLDGRITADTTLVNAADDGTRVMYALDGPVFVGGDNTDSAVLTIEPGTVVFGRSGGDYLVISRGSQIVADATADAPIIMTSSQDVLGEETGAGQWGGFVVLGNAPSNRCPADGSDCALQVEGVEEGAVFGGTDDTDNSGTLRYVVVKHAGFEIAPDNELNGITFGGVGSGTTVEYIQVHGNADDGIEMFGGNVDFKYVVLTSIQDDSIDWDNGWQGRMQYVYVEQDPNGGDANRVIEADNDGGNPAAEPKSNPVIANFTAIGNNFAGSDPSEGILLREGTGAQIYNMVVTGPSEMGECLEVESEAVSQANLGDGTITIENSFMACNNGENFKFDAAAGDVDLEDWFLNTQQNNQVSTSVMLASDGQPMAGSPLLGAGQNVANTVDGWFDETDFVGALDGQTDWRDGWAFGFGGGEVTAGGSEAPVAGCPAGTEAISAIAGQTTCQLEGVYTSDLTLTAGNLYAVSGPVFIGGDNADSAVLTVEPGVTLFGRTGNDYLVISRGSQIMAEGTAAEPITLTSSQAVNGETTAAGQWGGLVILGNAPSNRCPATGDCALQVEGVEAGAVFGGTDTTDNSGTLRYVRVANGGFEIAPDNELNGITFGGVGSGTTVEYLQVHQNADDGIEMFGGNVNFKYVVLSSIQDDSIDWDNGWQGNIQYVLVKHAADNSDANRAIEADNDGGNPAAEPQSLPTIANFTVIGNDFAGTDAAEGIYLREGTGANFFNTIVTGSAGMGECFEVESEAVTQANLSDGDISFANSVFACENDENFKFDAAAGDVDLEDWFLNTQTANRVEAGGRAAVLNGVLTIQTTTTPYDFSGDAFFDNADFIGAVNEGDDWTAGWTIDFE